MGSVCSLQAIGALKNGHCGIVLRRSGFDGGKNGLTDMFKAKLILILAICLAAACSFGTRNGDSVSGKPAEPLATATPSASKPENKNAKKAPISTAAEIPATKAECHAIDTGDNVILKSQTFPVDFEPFAGSCFVTTHNPENEDPPMEAEIAIYTDGKKVFHFPEQFNGVANYACWVDAVSFQDLNADKLTDIIVVGKCSAKTAPYNENMVYVNTGKAFVTSEEANRSLIDFTKTKAIADFVKANKNKFFK